MRRLGGWVAYLTPMVLVAVLAVVLFGCGTPLAAPVTTDPPATTVPATTTTVVQVLRLEAAPSAAPAMVARRIDPPETTVDPAVVWAAYPCAQWAGVALAVGWPVGQLPKLLRTMWRESRCQPEVRSTTSDSGLLQLNDIVLRDWRFQRDWPNFDRTTIFDPAVNLAVALWLWNIDSWTPWRGGA